MSTDKPSTDLIALSFEAQAVRTLIDPFGMTWWVAVDVCRILDLDNVSRAIAGLDEDERNTVTISKGIPGNPTVNIVNEPGLWRLVLTSRKPEAKRFQRWLIHDVLPSIRQTGGYEQYSSPLPDVKEVPRIGGWQELRRISLTQVRVFTYFYNQPERWRHTLHLREDLALGVWAARFYVRYFTHHGVLLKLHAHPRNFYRLDPQAAQRQGVLWRQLMVARTLPEHQLPHLPSPEWDMLMHG